MKLAYTMIYLNNVSSGEFTVKTQLDVDLAILKLERITNKLQFWFTGDKDYSLKLPAKYNTVLN